LAGDTRHVDGIHETSNHPVQARQSRFRDRGLAVLPATPTNVNNPQGMLDWHRARRAELTINQLIGAQLDMTNITCTQAYLYWKSGSGCLNVCHAVIPAFPS